MTQSKDNSITIIDNFAGNDTLTVTVPETDDYDFPIASEDAFTITGSVDEGTFTITLNDTDPDFSTVTGSSDINLDWISDIKLPTDEVWIDRLPKLDRVKKMCTEYPALEKAYENFKSIYNMVDQDYKGKLKERGDFDDDDLPF